MSKRFGRSRRRKMRQAIEVYQQAIAEVRHAQDAGPSWYTKGDSGLYQQVRMWLDRADKATATLAGPTL